MRGKTLHIACILVISFICVTFIAEPGLTIMVKLSTEEMTNGASEIVRGRVKNVKSQWNVEKTTIFTLVTISSNECIKGNVKDSELIIRYEGGVVGNIAITVSDMPTFKQGEDVLVFLTNSKMSGKKRVYGLFQGKCTIENGFILEKDVPLSEFVSRIKSIMKAQSQK